MMRVIKMKIKGWLNYRSSRIEARDRAAGLAVGQILSGALAKQKPAAGRKEADHVVEHNGSRQFVFWIGRMGSC